MRSPRFLTATGAVWFVLHVFGIALPTAMGEDTHAVRGMVASLEDEVRELSEERIAWSTFWKLCWEAYPGATGYEMELLTSEGASPTLRNQSAQCFRIEVASGENERKEEFVHRDLQIALQSGQLAIRVRAMFGEGKVGAWSPTIALGTLMTVLHTPLEKTD